ncbi:hypothetical protein T08_795 [Trichinella sp. T8]|nr:hypothetical protein T08_795 [Trichinella sp. T8]
MNWVVAFVGLSRASSSAEEQSLHMMLKKIIKKMIGIRLRLLEQSQLSPSTIFHLSEITLHYNNDNDNDSAMQMGIFNLRTRRTNRLFIMYIYLLKMLQHFLKQKMNLNDDKAALLKANRPSKSSAAVVKSMPAFHPADDEREGIRSHCIHHHLMQAVLEEYFRTITADVILSAEGISCHSNPEAISYI